MPYLAPVCVHRPSTVVPDHQASLQDVVELASRAFGERGLAEKFKGHMLATGVARRHFIRDPEEIFARGSGPRDWPETVRLLAEIGARAALQALNEANLEPHEIDALIVTSVCGYQMPGVEGHIARAVGLRPDIRCLPFSQVGCSGGLYGLIRAQEQLAAYPDAAILVVATEAFSTVMQPNATRLDALIYKALGGDGAAATVVVAERAAPADRPHSLLSDPFEYRIPQTEDYYQLTADDGGYLGFTSTAKAPKAIDAAAADLKAWAKGRPAGVMVAHHGGPAILARTAEVFSLTDAEVRHSRASLTEFGNMGSVSVHDIHRRTLDDPALAGREHHGTCLSIGPGVNICATRLVLRPGGATGTAPAR